MGLALHGGKPAAVCCTSGTALLNIHPAVAEAYYQLGETAKADEMMKALADKAVEYLTWYLSLDDNRFMISTREFEYHWAVLDAEVKAMKKYNSKLAEIYEPKVEELYNMYVDRMKE